MKIIVGKCYVTRSGDIARIVPSKPEAEDYYPIWGFVGDTELTWCADGRYYAGEDHEESMYDLVAPCEPAPFTMDARATMAMHFMATRHEAQDRASAVTFSIADADAALIAKLAKGETE